MPTSSVKDVLMLIGPVNRKHKNKPYITLTFSACWPCAFRPNKMAVGAVARLEVYDIRVNQN